MHAVIPLKGFELGKARLAPELTPTTRSALARETATRVITACGAAGFDITVVTADPDVAHWAEDLGALVVPDLAGDLDAACIAGVAARPAPWVVAHGDLPLLDAPTMDRVRRSLESGIAVIAPARDGGTNLIGHVVPIEFAYGPGSFHRHLGAVAPAPLILTGLTTLIELDTPADLVAASVLPGAEWLVPFLS